MTHKTSNAVSLTLLCAATLPAAAQVSYDITRIDDNTISMTGTGTLETDLTSVEQIRFVGASSQTNDIPNVLTGNLSFGGVLFPDGGAGNTDTIALIFGSAIDLTTADGPEGVGGISTTENDFLVAPIGTNGDVIALAGFDVTVIGTYRIVPEPTSLALLGLGGLLVAARRRR